MACLAFRAAHDRTGKRNVKTSQPTPSFIAPLLAAGALMAMLMGTHSSMGMFLGPTVTATTFGVATVSLAVALSELAWGAEQPVAGLMAGRFGTARVIAAPLQMGVVAQRVPAEKCR